MARMVHPPPCPSTQGGDRWVMRLQRRRLMPLLFPSAGERGQRMRGIRAAASDPGAGQDDPCQAVRSIFSLR